MKFLALSILVGLLGCEPKQVVREDLKPQESKQASIEEASVKEVLNTTKGYQLMKQSCFGCHAEKMNPALHDSMIAPPMKMVQRHYKSEYPKREDFVVALTNWVNQPSEDRSLMPGALRRFGLMGNITVNSEDLSKIADTLYSADFGDMPKGHHSEGQSEGCEH